jgi:hypothetical protein
MVFYFNHKGAMHNKKKATSGASVHQRYLRTLLPDLLIFQADTAAPSIMALNFGETSG